MNIISIAAVIFSIGLSFFFVMQMAKEKVNVIKVFTMALGLYISLYSLVASVLLYFDRFSVILCIRIVIVCLALASIVAYIVKRRSNHDILDWNIRPYAWIIVLIILAELVTILKSTPVMPMMDAGCYTCKAVQLMGDETEHTLSLEELNYTESPMVKSFIVEDQTIMAGLYGEEKDGEYYYSYHGLPTWPAVMALFGHMFGMKYITQALSMMLILAIFAFYESCLNLNINKLTANLLATIFTLAPLIMFLYKDPLSEGMIIGLVLLNLMLISERDSSLRYIAGLSIFSMILSHITMLVYVPIFALVLFVLFLFKRDRFYGIINILLCIATAGMVFYSRQVSFTYFKLNFEGRIEFLSIDEIAAIMILGALAIAVIQLVFMMVWIRVSKKKEIDLTKLQFGMEIILKVGLILVVLFTFYAAYKLGFTDSLNVGYGSSRFRSLYINQGLKSMGHLVFVNIVMAMGWVAFPVLIYQTIKTKHIGISQICLNMIWIYAFMLYNVIKHDVPTNYTSSRYFAIVLIPVALIALGLYDTSKPVMIIATAVAVLFAIPFDYKLFAIEEYKNSASILEDVSEVVTDNACVVLSDKSTGVVNWNLYCNLQETDDCVVFYSDTYRYVKSQFKEYPVYYISTHEIEDDSDYEMIFHKRYTYTSELGSLDVVYPTKVGTMKVDLYIYQDEME